MSAMRDMNISPRAVAGRGEPLFSNEPTTLPELFRTAAHTFDRADALSYKRGGRWNHIASRTIVARAEAIAAGLQRLGSQRGDRAAILAANSPEWTLVDAGCQFAGMIDVPIYTTLTPESIRFILNDSSARVLFLDGIEAYERISDELPNCQSVERLVFFERPDIEIPRSITLAELEKNSNEADTENRGEVDECTTKADDIATIIYTSGTTGEPKGVMLTHANIISNVIDAGEKYSFSQNDRALSVLPLSHIFERSAMYLYILNGMAVHYAESIEQVPENLAEVRPTIFVGVPRIFEKVYAKAKLKAAQGSRLKERLFDWAIETAKRFADLNEASRPVTLALAIKHSLADRLVYSKFRDFFGGRLKFCITGGAALSDEIYLIFTGAGVPIMQGYGLTETSPVISSNNPQASRLGSVGRPIRNVKVRIADDGEIEVSGPGVMLGYFNRPDATREAFTDDGWFRTGDIGEIDPDGFLRITDRKKELFKTSGGKYIAPSRIEQMILASRFVNQAVLIGNERKFAAALIVPNFEMLDSYAKHKGFETMAPAEYCRDPRIVDLFERQVASVTKGLARYETVKKIALIDKEMTVAGGELTPTMKLRRRVVDEKYKDTIDALYSNADRVN